LCICEAVSSKGAGWTEDGRGACRAETQSAVGINPITKYPSGCLWLIGALGGGTY